VCTAPVGTTTCTVTGLTPGTTYAIAVRSIGATSSSVDSSAVSFTTTPRVDAGGDSADLATVIRPGVTEDYIDSASDIDWWALDVAGAGDLQIALDQLPADYDILVYSANGFLVGSGYRAGTAAEQVDLRVAAGRYFMRVNGWNGAASTSQAYRLTTALQLDRPVPADLAGDSVASATQLSEGTTNEFLTVGDVDFWQITVAQTSTLTLTLGSLPADFDLLLLDATGTTVVASSLRPGVIDDVISLQVEAGVYVARVSGFLGAGSDESAYALTLDLVDVLPPPIPDLGGDTGAEATDLVPGVTVTDPLDTSTDVDFWRLTVPTLSRVTVTLSALPADYTLSLRTADGSVIATSRRPGTSDESLSVWLEPGSYLVRVIAVGRTSSPAPYALLANVQSLGRDVLDQAGNTVRTATPMTASEVDEIIHAPADRDVWSFVVPQTGTYALTLSTLPADYTLTLLTASGRTRAISANPGTADESITARLTAGTYLLRVAPAPGQWSMRDYHFAAIRLP
jgi:hypothetical protein